MRKLFCSRDSVSGTWLDPQAFYTEAEAERSFNWALASCDFPDSYAKDVDLYYVGTFDEVTGLVEPCTPIHIASGVNDTIKALRAYIKRKHKEVSNNEIFKEEE